MMNDGFQTQEIKVYRPDGNIGTNHPEGPESREVLYFSKF